MASAPHRGVDGLVTVSIPIHFLDVLLAEAQRVNINLQMHRNANLNRNKKNL